MRFASVTKLFLELFDFASKVSNRSRLLYWLVIATVNDDETTCARITARATCRTRLYSIALADCISSTH